MEFGPRALGNRSILMDPTRSNAKDLLNLVIKEREAFRPFAPAVKSERASEFFEISSNHLDSFEQMLFTTKVRPEYQSQLPAVTHCDGTARVQVVTKEQNPLFWKLLDCFEIKTNVPVLLNTSFNIQEPIVCKPSDAIATFKRSGIDVLVMNRKVVSRRELIL
jgi:carbamoyltransferase